MVENENTAMWHTADTFRMQVCAELSQLKKNELSALRGDYLFIIDEQPRFVLVVEPEQVWSVGLKCGHKPTDVFPKHASCTLTEYDIQTMIAGGARACVHTDSLTLQKVLTGALKARVAFVTAKVVVKGDLPAFLKMVSLLKRQGVRPVGAGAVFFVTLEKNQHPEEILDYFESRSFAESEHVYSAQMAWREAQGAPCALLHISDAQRTDKPSALSIQNIRECLVVVSYHLEQPWKNESVLLEACYFLQKKSEKFTLSSFSLNPETTLSQHKNGVLFASANAHKKTITENFESDFYARCKDIFEQIVPHKIKLAVGQMFLFEPVFIPKPWGQEIWFTGVEKRGVSEVRAANGKVKLPLPWLVSVLPKRLLGEAFAQKNLVLVKILDPVSTPVKGDLYYELHNEKNEVYVVTSIASGSGQIKIGANPQVRARLQNDETFKKEFLQSIQTYEKVRRKIDYLLDESLPVPPELEAEEQKCRQHMDSFTGFLNLKVGDVVRVPIHVPHALQHGVQVVEFQTPTYERFIISFAQKVLTQNHWDTEAAFDVMKLVEPAHVPLEVLQKTRGFKIENVCSFQEFSAQRVTLEAEARFTVSSQPFYQVFYLIHGTCEVIQGCDAGLQLKAGDCFCLPTKTECVLQSHGDSVFLMCFPH